MGVLLGFSRAVDWVNEKVGAVANLMILFACIVSAGNAMTRYAFDMSSNAWLEAQWYMFAFVVMMGASYTLRRNEHVRVDVFYASLSERGQHWIDVLGTILFMLPTCVLLVWLSWPFFMQSYVVNEGSNNAGGLLRWPVKLLIPAGFALLTLQGLSELIKRIAALQGLAAVDAKYERPTQ